MNDNRPQRKYTKSVDITVNLCVSRIGKATAQMYMALNYATKKMEKRLIGAKDDVGKNPSKKEAQPGLKAFRKKVAIQTNKPDVVSALFRPNNVQIDSRRDRRAL